MPFLNLRTQLCFSASLERNLLLDMGVERFSPLLFNIKTVLGTSSLLFKGFCSPLAQPVKIFCTQSCHIVLIMHVHYRKLATLSIYRVRRSERDCQNARSSAKSPKDSTVGDVFYSFCLQKIRSGY